MKKEEIIYQNQWCKIVTSGTVYVLKSKSNKYNDQYFATLDDCYKKTGLPPVITHLPNLRLKTN